MNNKKHHQVLLYMYTTFFPTYIENLPCIGRMLQCTCSQTANENCEDQQYTRKLKIAGSNILLRFSEQFDGDILLK